MSVNLKALKNKRLILFISVVVIIIVLIISWVRLVNAINICDDEVVLRYNNSFKPENSKNFNADIKMLSKEIEAKRGYSKDITCNYLVYQYYSGQHDATKSRELLENIKNLSSKGKKINPKVKNLRPIDEMESFIKALEFKNINREITNDKG